MLHIDGYSLVRKDRETRGGGVCIYVSNIYTFNLIDTSQNIEQLWIQIRINETSYAVGVFYNPPKTNNKFFIDELEQTLSWCSSVSDKLICFGDININMLSHTSVESVYFCNMLNVLDLQQIITDPTHITSSSKTLIDIIIVSDPSLIVTHGVGGLHISNHELVYCNLNVCKPPRKPTFKTYRCFKHFNETAFEIELSNIPFDLIFQMLNVNDKIQFFECKNY
jgi:hypothetical protein